MSRGRSDRLIEYLGIPVDKLGEFTDEHGNLRAREDNIGLAAKPA
jgi:hypothetical protein